MSSRQAAITNRTLWTFFACTLIQYVQDLTTVTDENVRVLFAPLLSFLRINNPQYADLLATAQMVFAQIANRTPLNREILLAIFENAVAGISPANLHNALIFLLAMYRSQTIAEIPSKAFARLLLTQGFEDVVSQINKTYEADVMIRPMFLAAVEAVSSGISSDKVTAKAEAFVQAILKSGDPTVESIGFLAEKIVERYLDSLSAKKGDDVTERLRKMLYLVQRGQSHVVDQVVQSALETAAKRGNALHKQAIFDFVSSTFRGTGGEVVEDANTTLYLGLQHVDRRIRLMSLEKLQDSLKDSKAEKMDFLEDILLSRLQDDDDNILKLVLNLDNLPDLIEPTTLLPALQLLLRSEAPSAKNKGRAFDLCAQLLPGLSNAEAISVKLDMLGCFMLTKGTRRLNKHAFAAARNHKFPLWSLTRGAYKFVADVDKVTEQKDTKNAQVSILVDSARRLLDLLATNLDQAKEQDGVRLYVEGLSAPSISTRVLSVLVLSKAIQQAAEADRLRLASRIVPIIVERLKTFDFSAHSLKKSAIETEDGSPSAGMLKEVVTLHAYRVTTQTVELQIMLYALQNVVLNINRPNSHSIAWVAPQSQADSETEIGNYRQLLVSLYKSLSGLGTQAIIADIVMAMIQRHLAIDAIQFSAAFWVNEGIVRRCHSLFAPLFSNHII